MDLLRRIGGIVLFLFLFSACVRDDSFNKMIKPEGCFALISEEPQRVSEHMILKITEIADYRCPVGSICSTTGEVEIFVQSYVDGEMTDLQLTYNKSHSSCEKSYKGHKIRIVDVTPHLYADEPAIDLQNYRVYISIEIE